MTPDALRLLAFAAFGAALGALYFGGLWLTVVSLTRRARPMLWLLGSTAVRLGLLVVALYLVARGAWDLVACVAGFIAVRTWFLHRARLVRPAASPSP